MRPVWAVLFVSLVYALWLAMGWAVLNDWCKYSIASLRRELALNGVGGSGGDQDFRVTLVLMYYILMSVWPVTAYRKVRTGRIVGRDFRERK